MDNKNILRKAMKNKRLLLTNDAKKHLDLKIFNNLARLDVYKNAGGILLYYPLAGEINTLLIKDDCEKRKTPVAFPVTDSKNYDITFYETNNFVKGMFGVVEPDKAKSKIIDINTFEVCILPGLSFSKSGARLGYGKGCYDRFLSNYRGVKIGLCYEDFLNDEIIMNEFDVYMDYVICERAVYDCIKERTERQN